MRVVRSSDYRAGSAWGADLIAAMRDATVRLHWTDQPYGWHVNCAHPRGQARVLVVERAGSV